jgi:protein-S-isoprenylcysteine O-methyltransferase Ste14
MSQVAARTDPRQVGQWRDAARWMVQTLADRVLPAALFGLLAAGKLRATAMALGRGPAGGSSLDAAEHTSLVAYYALSAVFMGAAALLFVLRKSSVRKLPGVRPKVVALAGTYALTGLPMLPVTFDGWWVTLPAGVLLTAGTVAVVATVLALGRCFGIMPEARGLVTSGPYRWVRHPLYATEALASTGLLLPVLSPLAVAIFGVYLYLTLRRTVYEEAVLVAAFPDYAAYRQQTRWRFIPGVV